MGGRQAAFVGAVGFLGEVCVLQLAVSLNADGSGSEHEIVACGPVISCKVEVVHCTIFCADNRSLFEAVVKSGRQSGVCRFRFIGTKVSDEEEWQVFFVDFSDSSTDASC